MRTLVAIPVYNEEQYVCPVLAKVLVYSQDVLVIDDGSTDRTVATLPKLPVDVIRHATNRGYGRSLRDAFNWADINAYDWVITMDCDEQHEPAAIPEFMAAIREGTADVISGTRYLVKNGGDHPPPERRAINAQITAELNERLGPAGLSLTDAFCGFKAYRVESLRRMKLTESGYAFPMQFWVQAAALGLRVREIPVKLIYNDPNRNFGGPLDDPSNRIKHYRQVLHCELEKWVERLPRVALNGVDEGCGKTKFGI
jgi:glycosyltransferase involved in cell wall biosynthesis